MAVQVIASSYTDGPTLVAAAAASALPTYVPTSIPAGYWQIGRIWRLTASGRISNVVTTPGTARYDLRLGAVTVFDTLAMPLNIVAKTNVSWNLQVLLTCRSVGTGTSATLFGQGWWLSEASINTAVPATGPGPGGQAVPYNTAPVVGAGFDSTIANALDFRFTQTVATGSMTVHQFLIEQLTP
jgi:hypothetical protein